MIKQIFAHRAILNSPENSLEGIQNCVDNNLSIELDLRYNGSVYLAHDKIKSNVLFEDACKILTNSQSFVSLHLKELSVINYTIKIIKKYSLQKKCFLFMTDLDYKKIKNIVSNDIDVGYYASSVPMKTNSKFYWCDELKSKWYDKKIIQDLHTQNIFCIAMSPELTKKTSKNEIKLEWERLINLNFDGICTDFPLELNDFVRNIK